MSKLMAITTAGNTQAGAVFSPDRTYRYGLWRRWSDAPQLLWILLNPSTADEHKLDPTLTRCLNFSRAWGYGGFAVGNLFAWRATQPAALYQVPDPVSPANDTALIDAVNDAALVVLGWGNHGHYRHRAAQVLALLVNRNTPLYCLRLTAQGQPAHPLYLKRSLALQPFEN